MYILLILIIVCGRIYAQYGVTYREPKLECSSEGIRLHVTPIANFTGHIYVKGFFLSDACHLNFVDNATSQSFVMDIPYRETCNVRRHRGYNPPSISYETTVVFQHHPLFVTGGDRAFKLNCIYRQADKIVSQNISVSDLTTENVASTSHPTCKYVVTSPEGNPLRFANVGDRVVHKWTCNSEAFGFLVHSCVVRNDLGEEYKLVDERGCVIDTDLIPDLIYASDFSSVTTGIRAFRFAEQVMVHFTCQVTLCRKDAQGCEGIAPPICQPIEFPPIVAEYKTTTPADDVQPFDSTEVDFNAATFVSSSNAPATIASTEETATPDWQKVISDSISNLELSTKEPSTLPSRSSYTKTPYSVAPEVPNIQQDHGTENRASTLRTGSSKWANGVIAGTDVPNEYGLEIVDVSKDSMFDPENYRTHQLSSTMSEDPLPFPTAADVYFGSRKPRSHGTQENITMEVEAKDFIVLAPDNPMEPPVSVSPNPPTISAQDMMINQTIWLCGGLALQITLISVIIGQRLFYKRLIARLTPKGKQSLY